MRKIIVVLGVFVMVGLGMFVDRAGAQTVSCPAGSPGGVGGNGGTASNVGNGGFGLFATASGWYGGTLAGGEGGAGGNGYMPICNSNGSGGSDPGVVVVPQVGGLGLTTQPTGIGGASNRVSEVSGLSLAATGNGVNHYVLLAGLMLLLGGSMVVYGQGTAEWSR